ncbi:uncharacterized protein zgc:194981 isoform X1 [Pimephales promelas]|uniref:uncharacterized protein zgc:194981 isoform X1 n=1 Tax=Pimephales promelas TaxID=90988 RepID=UPI001955F486|nr:uncharacterized protein zgc:194981 isoform X1 [Pimephales promelas]XP_039529828.1 uncharacterized protein zgc:194981 isoform X1 [Pimephales promelas]KAG1950167.1 hypothetical protein F2P79_011754 [Pimephales promelas]
MVCTRILFASIVSALIVSEVEMRNDDSNVIISVANFAMNFHNRMSSYPYAFKVVDIISDTTQLYPPARVKYILQIQAGQTVCENQASVNLTHCALQSNPECRETTTSPNECCQITAPENNDGDVVSNACACFVPHILCGMLIIRITIRIF